MRFSQHLDASPFLNLTIHFPPLELASSYGRNDWMFVRFEHSCQRFSFKTIFGDTHLPHGFNTRFKKMNVVMTLQIGRPH